MASILSDVRGILELAGFATFSPRPDSPLLYFEDISIMGQAHVFDAVDDVVVRWERIQDEFLRANAQRFGKDITKAWNLYTVLLTSETVAEAILAKLLAIEEDFRGTRKIARGGVTSRDDVVLALAPILPLQNLLSVGLADAKQRLLDRLGASNPALRLVLTEAKPDAIAATLLGAE
jgi:hypothetical protein